MSELLVRIRDLNVPISVTKIENGLEVGTREVLVDDYIRSLLDSLNEEELIGYLMEKNFLEVTLKYLSGEGVSDSIYTEIFKLFIERCKEFTGKDIKEHDLFTKLFTIMLEKVNVQNVNKELLGDLLSNILKNVDSTDLKDTAIYNKLFRLLLKKVDINNGTSLVIKDFLNLLLENMKNNKNQEDLKEIFELLVAKGAEAEWVEEVIRKRKPQTATFKTPILPLGTLFYKESISGLKTVVMEVPKHNRDLQFQDLHYKEVGHPNLLFVYQISGKQVKNMMLFARDSKPLTEESMLYHYPYAHVYDSGNVCWGFRSEVVNKLDDLKILTNMFLETANNHDLARKGSVTRMIRSQKKDFDEKLLETTNLTFKRLVDTI